uniref:Uncharacterized protein n=1 Tax=Pantoea phage Survivor TaxID=3232176 RepID=A0AAU8KX99_9CAUD
MKTEKVVSDILNNAALNKDQVPYKNVYFVKVLNPGDRVNLFVSFRFKTSGGEVFICRADINLEKTEKNVRFGIHHLIPIKRESFTLFQKNLTIGHRSIVEIINGTIAPAFTERLNRLEEMLHGN